MAFGSPLGSQVLNLVESWTPSKAYRKETSFRDDLMDYLESNLNSSGGMLGPNRTYSLRKERGKSRADIAIDDEVGIELKRAVTNGKLRRLRDQIRDYEKEYGFVIICACGMKETGKWNELRQDFEGSGMGMGMGSPTTIRFVEKRKNGRTFRDSGKGASGGFFGGGGGLF